MRKDLVQLRQVSLPRPAMSCGEHGLSKDDGSIEVYMYRIYFYLYILYSYYLYSYIVPKQTIYIINIYNIVSHVMTFLI